MILPSHLTEQGFELADVNGADLEDYLAVKRVCYEKYVEEYYGGGWNVEINKRDFASSFEVTCFKKILMNGKTVGFFAFDERHDEIGHISIQMLDEARNMGIGSFYLSFVTELSEKSGKPAILKVFKSNPARELYKRFGFKVCCEDKTHYYMSYYSEGGISL